MPGGAWQALMAAGRLDMEKTPKYDRAWMWDFFMAPWRELQKQGVGIHVGEFACYNQTPDAVTLAWMEDWLVNWKRAGWGWAMWNFRGAFGPVDSGRTDVTYENWKGLKVDRKMLDLIQAH